MNCSVHNCENKAEIGCFCQECYDKIDTPESEPITEIESDGLIVTSG